MKLKIAFPSLEIYEEWLSIKTYKMERSRIILCSAIILYGLLFSVLTIFRFYAFGTRAWDLGIFTQSLWTTAYAGKFLYHTCELFINPSGVFFGVHFSPILFFVLPFYWAVPRPETLLVLQSFAIGSAAIPIYKLAKEYAGGRIVGLIFAVAYLLYPATQYVNMYDFHVQAFLPLFFTFAIYYATKEDWSKYFVFILFSLMCEEHVAFIVFFVGVYIAWKYRSQVISIFKSRERPRTGLFIAFATMIIGVVWYWFTLWQRDTFFPTNPVTIEAFLGSGNFAILGAKSPLEVPIAAILHPLNAIQALTYDGQLKLLYLLLLFGPLAFYSIKAPSVLIPTISWFGFSFFSQASVHHVLGHHYEAYVASFIFAAAIFGLRKNFVKKSTLKNIRASLMKIVLLSLAFSFVASPLSPVTNALFPSSTCFQIGEHERLLSETINKVPSNASILTQDNLFPQISHRTNAYVIPVIFLTCTIRNIVTEFTNRTIDTVDYVLLDNKTDSISTSFVLSLLMTKPSFTLIISEDDGTILLYQRKP
jgi:uncharacterized membrane protein